MQHDMDVYLDLLFLINFILNALVLRTAARAGGAVLPLRRLCAAAALGALGAGGVLLLPDALPLTLAAKLALTLLTVFAAFGRRGAGRQTVLTLLCSFLYGGGIWALSLLLGGGVYTVRGIAYADVTVPGLLFSAAGLHALLYFCAGRWCARFTGPHLCEICCERGSRQVRFCAKRDTGCALRDPVSNAPVLLAEAEVLAPLFSRETVGLLARLPREGPSVLACLPDGERHLFRLVPCRTVAGQALLPTFRPDRLTVNGRPLSALVALSPSALADVGARALLGEDAGT